jgi:hypothetical protein
MLVNSSSPDPPSKVEKNHCAAGSVEYADIPVISPPTFCCREETTGILVIGDAAPAMYIRRFESTAILVPRDTSKPEIGGVEQRGSRRV